MIKQENIGNNLVKTYSDAGFVIHGGFPEADRIEAIDPIDAGRTYTETNIPIPQPEDDSEAEISDYQAALAELGVE